MPRVKLSAIQVAVLAENTDCISVSFHNGTTIAKAVSFAAKQNKTKSLQLLLDIGQDPDDMVDEEDCATSLMWAVAQGHHECVHILATLRLTLKNQERMGSLLCGRCGRKHPWEIASNNQSVFWNHMYVTRYSSILYSLYALFRSHHEFAKCLETLIENGANMNLSLSKDNVLVPGVELSAIQVAVGKNTFIRRINKNAYQHCVAPV